MPDVRKVQFLKDFFYAIEEAHDSGVVLAYHDAGSDGGIFTAIVEMIFAGRCGASLLLENFCRNETADIISTLFTEELAAVFQVGKRDETMFKRCFANCGPPPEMIERIGTVTSDQELSIYHNADPASLLYRNRRSELQKFWSSTSYHMQRVRNNPDCADTEQATFEDDSDPGLSYNITFGPAEPLHGKSFLNSAPSLASKFSQRLSLKQKPLVAILREQGVNGAKEMAYAGFLAEDVHMTDLIYGRKSFSSFVGLTACGGFSDGDVLGAGRGSEYSFALISSCGMLKN
ncbi:hypothetical protein HO173_010161 [Letharia columbiana]|uniref:PurM-like C-terminal domain-containing protein n=1 Tax=Letharia columbiana TaxID=112416 RepID=A0A8H6L136_9LECA|nr:uncharacterized protein HO173_010161 [Letharia columbiana]KAF6231629.1 hypothetical protein HO173_010161 [Letharia columbiana]